LHLPKNFHGLRGLLAEERNGKVITAEEKLAQPYGTGGKKLLISALPEEEKNRKESFFLE